MLIKKQKKHNHKLGVKLSMNNKTKVEFQDSTFFILDTP